MELLYILLVLLVITRACGELAIRLKQPPLVGELIAGIGLGLIVRSYAHTFPVLAELPENPVFLSITDLGIFFLMLLGGLEMRPKDLVKASGSSLIVAISAMLLPLGLGFALAWPFLPASDLRFAQAAFVGTAMAITAVPVAIRVLMDLDLLKTKAGQLIVSAAVVDDVLSLIILAMLTALITTGGLPEMTEMLVLVGKVVIFFAVTVILGKYGLSAIGRSVKRFMRLDELEFSFLLIVALGFALLAELLGMHFILGAFVAGLFFGRRTIDAEVYADVKNKVSAITTGFLAPVFFASIGLHLDLSAVTAIPMFLALLIVIAFGSKWVGAAAPAKAFGHSYKESAIVGVAMSARGAVELVIADVALRAGLFNVPQPVPDVVEYLFSAIVIVAIVTTLMVPIGLRWIVYSHNDTS